MSNIRKYRRGLDPRKQRVAAMMARLQQAEPDPKKLKANFAEIFQQVFAPKQETVEVFEGKNPPVPVMTTSEVVP